MREGRFISKYKDRWNQYQAEPTDDPDVLARRFAYLVDDLAFARTFYKDSNTTRYINGMAADIYLSIYRNRKEKGNRFVTFWTTESAADPVPSQKSTLVFFRTVSRIFSPGNGVFRG
ncbi:MAG: hypothetical protein QM743_04630 [Chitinophagaceae bacterium]